VLRAALEGYRVREATADRLDLAVRLLGGLGRSCLPALRWVSSELAGGQSAFVSLAAGAPFLTEGERVELLEAVRSES